MCKRPCVITIPSSPYHHHHTIIAIPPSPYHHRHHNMSFHSYNNTIIYPGNSFSCNPCKEGQLPRNFIWATQWGWPRRLQILALTALSTAICGYIGQHGQVRRGMLSWKPIKIRDDEGCCHESQSKCRWWEVLSWEPITMEITRDAVMTANKNRDNERLTPSIAQCSSWAAGTASRCIMLPFFSVSSSPHTRLPDTLQWTHKWQHARDIVIWPSS